VIDALLDLLAVIDGYLWGPWTIGLLAGVAVWFTVRSGFFQLTGVRYILRHTLGRLAPGSTKAGCGRWRSSA
jgi:AGCS family alanine or glycine:cation symporter